MAGGSKKDTKGSKREVAELRVGDQTTTFPLLRGTDGSQAIDTSGLNAKMGLKAFNPGLADVAVCKSAISFVDGERGELLYRGYPIEELAEKTTFVETAYLLIRGSLPTLEEGDNFSRELTEKSNIHEDMKRYFDGFPSNASPMAMLSSMIIALSTFDQEDMMQKIGSSERARAFLQRQKPSPPFHTGEKGVSRTCTHRMNIRIAPTSCTCFLTGQTSGTTSTNAS